VQYVIEERFVVALSDPGEDSGKTTIHLVEAESAQQALSDYANRVETRLLGITERADNTVSATAWRKERLYRLRARPATEEDSPK
ncbi:MAG TPA: hypothetical protein VMS98_05350, partial [Thermoanaerobaculia bacterium]|nr:hypothetical protein [Thermoanaerobaculia bacterium]